LAFDRTGQRLVDWECGARDAATLTRLLERLKPWSVKLYCTDEYGPYDTLLPVGRPYIGKDETGAIERGNSRLVFIHLPLIRRAEEWRDVASRGVRRPGGR
jgi:insertion element IS1 protein InsB